MPNASHYRRLCIAAAATFLASCAPPRQPGAAAPDAGAAAPVAIPVVRDRGYALVSVSIRGRDSLWFVLDVAAGGSVISPATRQLLGLTEADGETRRVTGAGGEAEYPALKLDSLSVGPFVANQVGVNVIDLARFQSPQSGRTFAGILGNNVLKAFDFVLDLPRSTLLLYPRERGGLTRSGLPGTWECVANIARDEGWVSIELSVGGNPAKAIVDTGAGRSVFNWHAARLAGIGPDSPGVRKSATPTQGLGAQAAETHHYMFERLEAGATQFRAVESRIADLAVFGALGLAGEPAVIMGTNLIDDRAMAVIYSTREVCFSPRSPVVGG